MNIFKKIFFKSKAKIRIKLRNKDKEKKFNLNTEYGEIDHKIVYANNYIEIVKDSVDLSNIIYSISVNILFKDSMVELDKLYELIYRNTHLTSILKIDTETSTVHILIGGNIYQYVELFMLLKDIKLHNKFINYMIHDFYTLPINGFEKCIEEGIMQREKFTVEEINYDCKNHKNLEKSKLGKIDIINFDNIKFYKDKISDIFNVKDLLYLSKFIILSNDQYQCYNIGQLYTSNCDEEYYLYEIKTYELLKLFQKEKNDKTIMSLKQIIQLSPNYFSIEENKDLVKNIEDYIDTVIYDESENPYGNIDEIID